jgi:hypothetical protein
MKGVKFKRLDIFFKHRGVSIKTSGRFLKTLEAFYCNSRSTLLYMHRSIHSNAFKLVNTSFYSLSNKNETLKD